MTQKSESDVQYLLEKSKGLHFVNKWIPIITFSDTTHQWIYRRQANSGQSTLLEDEYFWW